MDAYFQRAYAYYDKGDSARAITEFSAALRLAPDSYGIYVGRGLAYALAHRWPEAIADYSEAIRLDPDSASTYIHRGYAYYNLEERAQAIADYTHALRLDPANQSAFYYRAQAFRADRRWALSFIDYYAAARGWKPGDVRVVAGLGVLYRKQGRYGLADSDSPRPSLFGRPIQRPSTGVHCRGSRRVNMAPHEEFCSCAKAADREAFAYLRFGSLSPRLGSGRLDMAFSDGGGVKADPKAWPGALIAFYRGLLTEDAVRKAAVSTDPLTERGRRCEADFYIAEWRLLHEGEGRPVDTERAVGECPDTFIEYEMAPVELNRLASKATLAEQPGAQ